jgi:DNA sulfur modification protein DndE
MSYTKRRVLLIGAALILVLAVGGYSAAANRINPVPEQEALEIGVEAYSYGYPLVTMEMTRRVMTNVATPLATKAPMGRFANVREYPDASFKDVTAPNADTLYSIAWLDLSKEAYVLHVPDENGRYYLMPMLDSWTNVFASPGKRTTGTKAGDYAITGPHWKGTLPRGVKAYKSATALVWIIGRTYSTGTSKDFKEVHAIQDQYSLKPLNTYGKPYFPPIGKVNPNIDMKMAPRDQVNHMTAATYFKLLTTLMKKNPPVAADAPIVAKMAKVGIVPGREFEMGKLDPVVAKALEQAATTGLAQIVAETQHMGKKVNGWQITFTGKYGSDYLFRAAVAFVGLGANLPQDALYPITSVDGNGLRLSGANKYVMHFDKGKFPPVNGFWSLTRYNAEYFFVKNPLNRYTLSERNKFNLNPDGSVDLYLQHQPPARNLVANWLPAPEGDFALTLRMYWPKEAVLKGSWEPPPVVQGQP